MRQDLLRFAALILIGFGPSPLLAEECKPDDRACVDEHKSGEVYRCPMHPEVVSDKPGRCPKCRMFLEKDESGKAKEGQPTPVPTPAK